MLARAARRPGRPRKPAAPSVVEGLEARRLLAATTFLKLTQVDASTLALDYEVARPIEGLPLRVYRSADAQLDPQSDLLVARGSLDDPIANIAPGTYRGVLLDLTPEVPGVDPLGSNPSMPYVIVQSYDQEGPTNPVVLQKYTLGLVTHGFLPPTEAGDLPAWVTQMAAALEAQGYDEAIAFDWSETAGVLLPGQATAAGVRAAAQVEQFVATPGNIPPGAVVDLHFIGHSRGSVVITQAMQSLEDDLANLPQLAGGRWKLTYLDPHPAHAANVVPFTVPTGNLGQVALALGNFVQEATQDPYPLVVPALVAEAEVYAERTPNGGIVETNVEWLINPQGAFPPGGFAPASPSTAFHVLDLSAPGMTHSATHLWYSEFVVPTIGSGGGFVDGPVVAPFTASGYTALAATVDVPLILNTLVATVDVTDPNLIQGDFTATIEWGDGGSSTGYVIGTALTGFGVFGEHVFTEPGTFAYKVSVANPSNGTQAVATGTFVVSAATVLARETGGPEVALTLSDTGAEFDRFRPFGPLSRGAVRVARGDVDGDGTPDTIVATGPGDPALVRVFSGRDGSLIRQFRPFPATYRGGVNLSVADLDGDGRAEIIATAAGGNVPLVTVHAGPLGRPILRFRPFGPGTGVTTEARDVTGDRLPDLVASSSRGEVAVTDGQVFLADREARELAATRRLRLAAATGRIPLRQALPLLGLGVAPPAGPIGPAGAFGGLFALARRSPRPVS